MAEEQNMKYIRFPISFIRDMLVDKETGIKKMILYGYSLVAGRSDIDEENAYRQIAFCFYRYVSVNQDEDGYFTKEPEDTNSRLPKYIKDEINDMISYNSFDVNEDYTGFDLSGSLDVDKEVRQLMERGKSNPNFHSLAMDYHRVRQTADLFNIRIYDYDSVLREYRKFSGSNARKTRMASVKLSQLFEYLFNRKTEAQLMLFAAFMGVKAIIGNENVKRTTKSYIIANMFGCMDETELQTMLVTPGNERLIELHKKYTTRKMFDRITTDLKEKNFIHEWLPMGKAGTFVSTKLNHKQFLKEVAKILDGRNNQPTASRGSAAEYRRTSKKELDEIRGHASG